jgi:hypothetical protein
VTVIIICHTAIEQFSIDASSALGHNHDLCTFTRFRHTSNSYFSKQLRTSLTLVLKAPVWGKSAAYIQTNMAIALYSEYHLKSINAFCGHGAVLLILK